jgi:hypothetical protein
MFWWVRLSFLLVIILLKWLTVDHTHIFNNIGLFAVKESRILMWTSVQTNGNGRPYYSLPLFILEWYVFDQLWSVHCVLNGNLNPNCLVRFITLLLDGQVIWCLDSGVRSLWLVLKRQSTLYSGNTKVSKKKGCFNPITVCLIYTVCQSCVLYVAVLSALVTSLTLMSAWLLRYSWKNLLHSERWKSHFL